MVPPTQKPSAWASLTLVTSRTDLEGGDRAELEVVVPAEVGLLGLDVLPGHEEHRETLLDHEAHQRIGRLQVHDVELVDAGRHDQQRGLDLLGERRVLDELWISGFS